MTETEQDALIEEECWRRVAQAAPNISFVSLFIMLGASAILGRIGMTLLWPLLIGESVELAYMWMGSTALAFSLISLVCVMIEIDKLYEFHARLRKARGQ